MTRAGEGSRRGLTESVPWGPEWCGVRGTRPELPGGPGGPWGVSEPWKAPSPLPLREKPAEASLEVAGGSPQLACGSALARRLQGFSACLCAGRGDRCRQSGGSPAPSGCFALDARRNRVAEAATGRSGRGQG